MNPCSGILEGDVFTAELPVIIMGWPSKSAVTTFENKAGMWNYIAAASARDSRAMHARAYEFNGSRWQRLPLFPTNLIRRELSVASLPLLS